MGPVEFALIFQLMLELEALTFSLVSEHKILTVYAFQAEEETGDPGCTKTQ